MYKYHNEIYSIVRGGEKYPDINGIVTFDRTVRGVLITAEIYGLPSQLEKGGFGVFAFHIHSGSECPSGKTDNSGTHFNPENKPHPYHAGDLPPLFSNRGYAYLQTVSDRFNLSDIVGKTVIIHSGADDFTTQPSGNSGEKIACGIIMRKS